MNEESLTVDLRLGGEAACLRPWALDSLPPKEITQSTLTKRRLRHRRSLVQAQTLGGSIVVDVFVLDGCRRGTKRTRFKGDTVGAI